MGLSDNKIENEITFEPRAGVYRCPACGEDTGDSPLTLADNDEKIRIQFARFGHGCILCFGSNERHAERDHRSLASGPDDDSAAAHLPLAEHLPDRFRDKWRGDVDIPRWRDHRKERAIYPSNRPRIKERATAVVRCAVELSRPPHVQHLSLGVDRRRDRFRRTVPSETLWESLEMQNGGTGLGICEKRGSGQPRAGVYRCPACGSGTGDSPLTLGT